MKGSIMTIVAIRTLAQRRSETMTEEVVTKLHRGSNTVKRSVTHLIQRRKKWRRCAHNLEGEGIRLESHWDYRELEE